MTGFTHSLAYSAGQGNLFVFIDPAMSGKTADVVDWAFAQEELAANKGLTSDAKNALNITAGMVWYGMVCQRIIANINIIPANNAMKIHNRYSVQ